LAKEAFVHPDGGFLLAKKVEKTNFFVDSRAIVRL
jgi:hypothetical protein